MNTNTRTLKLTHEEILMVEQALTIAYSTKEKVAKDHREILNPDDVKSIMGDAVSYDDLARKIRNGMTDV